MSDPSQWLVAPHKHEEQEKQTKRTKHTLEEKTVASVLRVPPRSTQEAPCGLLLTDETLTSKSNEKPRGTSSEPANR